MSAQPVIQAYLYDADELIERFPDLRLRLVKVPIKKMLPLLIKQKKILIATILN